jgi:Domain of unknown function (DUF4384)/Putative zinc-finger
MKEERDHLDHVIKRVSKMVKKLNPKPTLCPDEELLAAYLQGNLTQGEIDRIEEHLALCSECADTVISFSEVESMSYSERESYATDAMIKKVKDMVKPQEKLSLWERVSDWFAVLRPVPIMATVSVILVIAVLSIYKLQISDNSLKNIPLSIRLNIIARMPSEIQTRGTAPEYVEVGIEDGGVLNSGDLFRINFQLQEEAYVYLLSLDSQGNLTKLYPDKDMELPAKFESKKLYSFPTGDEWLKLDENTGQEIIYLLASPDPIKDIDLKIDQLEGSGINNIESIFPGIKIQSFNFKHEQ